MGNAVLDALSMQRELALEIWKRGLTMGIYSGLQVWSTRGDCAQFDLHNLSEGAAEIAVRWWLKEVIPLKLLQIGSPEVQRIRVLEFITGRGKSRRTCQAGDLHARITALLGELGATIVTSSNPGRVRIDSRVSLAAGTDTS